MDETLEKYNGIIKTQSQKERNSGIVKVSIVGIAANVLLSAFKAAIGFASGSIAIVLDAVNNLSDAASSLITIIGAKLANKAPDRDHPFGHGRAEYLSSSVIAVIVMYAGITSLIESVKKIITPVVPDYSVSALVIIAIAVAVKIVLGVYVKKQGENLDSSALVNSGKDAMLDSIVSASTLIAAIIFICGKVSLEAYLGVIISFLIIKAGYDMAREAVSSILGERTDKKLIREISRTMLSFKEVKGVYDIVLNNYGPASYTGSAHVEVNDTLTADKIDGLLRNISMKVMKEHNIVLTAIGIYSINTKDKKIIDMKKNILKILKEYKNVLQIHGFYFDKETQTVRFDIVVSFDEHDRQKLREDISRRVSAMYPKFAVEVQLDTDFSVSAE